MARYQRRVDVWTLTPEQRAALQPGQHITAGPDNPGVYLGQTRNGVDVAAWEGNARRHPEGRAAYIRTLREYALSRAA